MASRRGSRTPAPPAPPAPPVAEDRPDLAALGLTAGERVRWREKAGGRWREGTVVGRERDGSVGVRDGKGASRAFTVARLEVSARGPRGAKVWEPLAERADRTQQMPLFAEPPDDPRRR
jgi:hypothetical protein